MKGIQNWYTTVLGIIVAVAQYLYQVGPSFPTDAHGWGAFVVALLLAAWGAVQKDGRTGSAPGSVS